MRDALVGIALFLTHLALSRLKCSELRKQYPDYVIAKKKITLQPGFDFDSAMNQIREQFKTYQIDERDGMRIEYPDGWLQIRRSNTEPIIRIYAESTSSEKADNMAERVIKIIKNP